MEPTAFSTEALPPFALTDKLFDAYNVDIDRLTTNVKFYIRENNFPQHGHAHFSGSIMRSVSPVVDTEVFRDGMKAIADAILKMTIYGSHEQKELFPRESYGDTCLTVPVASFIRKCDTGIDTKYVPRGYMLSIANCITLCTEHKMEWYLENENTKMTSEHFTKDFMHIDHIIHMTGEMEETFPLSSMFPGIQSQLKNSACADKIKKAFLFREQEDTKNGLRAILLLVLQACIFCKSKNTKEDLNEFWNMYKTKMTTENGSADHPSVYSNLFYKLNIMAIGFRHLPVCDCLF